MSWDDFFRMVVSVTVSVLLLVLVLTGGFLSRVDVFNFDDPSFSSTTEIEPSFAESLKIPWGINCTSGTEPRITCPSSYQTRLDPNLTSTGSCPEYFRWIHEDLRPWKEIEITMEMLERPRALVDLDHSGRKLQSIVRSFSLLTNGRQRPNNQNASWGPHDSELHYYKCSTDETPTIVSSENLPTVSRTNTTMGNLNTIQHSCHPHTLIKNLLPLSPYTFKCYLCNGVLKYSAYYCYKCEFYVHEHCVKACPLILNHPLHPQHPLLLKHGIEQHFVCNGCGTRPWSRIAYACSKCDFHLEFACAVSALPLKEEVSVPEPPKIQYFGHEHPLMCFEAKSATVDYCWVCKEEIRGEGCGCFVCKLFLHNRCLASMRPRTENEGELTMEEAGGTNASSVVIEHPLHSQHPLYLYIDRVPRQCHACKSFCPSSMIEEIYWCYVCDQCHFCLDVSCVTKVVALSDPKVTIPPITHEHRLAHFSAKEETHIKCVVCKAPISGEFSGCPDCAIFFHNNCVVGVPETLEYSLHPEHPITLGMFRDKRFQRCPSCSGTLGDQLCYGCECGFAIHAKCAQRMQAYHEEGNSAEISLSWHEHAVRLCHRMHWDNGCSACLKSVEGLCYVCPNEECQLFLHRSCTRLTSEIQHPHHLNHKLSLVPFRSLGRYTCDACHEDIWGFRFSCSKCAFNLDTKCASIIPDRKHVLHEHNLTRFENIPSLKCNRCGNSCDSEFYRCVACDFNIHPPCMELPRRIKPKDHFHTMVLYDYYVDDDSGEYYCDFCEQRRNPDLGVYLCEQCKMQSKLVAHIECALSKSVVLKNDGVAERANERISRLRRDADEAKAKLEAVMSELEEAEQEHLAPPY